MRYYEVKAKCGHVGRNNYYIGTLFLWAENGKDAASVARRFPRVKHDQKDAILSVLEISRAEYEKGKAEIAKSAYWTSISVQEQRQNCPELVDSIHREETNKKKYAKKHSLRKIFHADPIFDEICDYRGDLSAVGF